MLAWFQGLYQPSLSPQSPGMALGTQPEPSGEQGPLLLTLAPPSLPHLMAPCGLHLGLWASPSHSIGSARGLAFVRTAPPTRQSSHRPPPLLRLPFRLCFCSLHQNFFYLSKNLKLVPLPRFAHFDGHVLCLHRHLFLPRHQSGDIARQTQATWV